MKTDDRPERFPIVGIGSSAGGLEALEQFFTNSAPNAGIAYILVSHLDPNHPSLLAELVGHFTTMKVLQAGEGMVVQPNTVYVIPPGKDIVISGGTLKLFERAQPRDHELHMPIDYFLQSLAEDQDIYAIAIILSGNGSDGSFGLRSVQANLGMVMVQSPDTAKYDSMPRSAIATGLADYVLPTTEMFGQLNKYVQTLKDKIRGSMPRASTADIDSIYKIMGILRSHTGHDFSMYKRNTINRRIERRMAVHQLDTKGKYIEFLRNNPDEIQMLFKELLIQVTKFFRDPEAFDTLKQTLRDNTFARDGGADNLRVWVPGCSTGEEVYSLAMIIMELIHETGRHIDVQIFGTDIDENAIGIARAGEYPISVATDIGDDRLNAFFTREDEMVKVKKEVRDLAIFAPQNLIRDPPFLRLDLLSCRNVLIYFEPPLQRKVMETFSFALAPQGLLFLGTSETINGFTEEFNTLDSKWKIYQRRRYDQPYIIRDLASMAFAPRGEQPRPEVVPAEPKITEVADKTLLSAFTPPSLIVNNKDEIVYFHGKTGKHVEHPSGKATLNVQALLKEDIRFQVMAAIRDARSSQKENKKNAIRVNINGDSSFLNIIVRPVEELKQIGGLLVVFEDMVIPKEILREHQDLSVSPDKDSYIHELERELTYTKESLQSTIEELETSNEELKSTNEELQSTNEELQSVAEESETAKEELHSLNEELLSVNAELEKRNDELQATNSDMRNLLNSIDVATIFLDTKFMIKRFTPQIGQIMNLIGSDLGRPLMDISMNIVYDDLFKDAEEVLDRLTMKEREIKTKDGRWYRVRILPYRTLDNVISGVVITFIDIDAQKRAQTELQTLTREIKKAREYAEGIIDTIDEPLVVIDKQLQVVSANDPFYRTFNANHRNLVGHDLKVMNGGVWDDPELIKGLTEVFVSGDTLEMTVQIGLPRSSQHEFRLRARTLPSINGDQMVLITLQPFCQPNL